MNELGVNDLTAVAIIPAAGSGLRLASSEVKALVKINGLTILEHVLKRISAFNVIKQIIVLAPKESLQQFHSIIEKFPRAHCIEGGETRQLSVFNGLKFIAENYSLSEQQNIRVLIHDAARCLIPSEVIERALEKSKASDALTCAVPIFDTMVRASDHQTVEEFVRRDAMWAVQTPQIFRYNLLFEAHKRASNDKCFDYTDDASILYKVQQVDIVQGSRDNIKITEKADLLLAEGIVQRT